MEVPTVGKQDLQPESSCQQLQGGDQFEALRYNVPMTNSMRGPKAKATVRILYKVTMNSTPDTYSSGGSDGVGITHQKKAHHAHR